MSHPEFENYLSLVQDLLGVRHPRSQDIAAELRDHFKERFADLLEQDIPNDEAVRQAIAEFGQAHELAGAFSIISRNRRKRWIMKWTTVSMGGLAAAALLAVALWPEHANLKLTPKAKAQAAADPAANPADPAASRVAAKEGAKSQDDNNAAAEAALSKQIAVDFVETPLRDVIEFVQDLAGIEFYVNSKKLEEEGIAKDTPITIQLKKVRLDMLLDLVLAQAGDGVAYVLRDGIVVVSSAADLENATEVRVYNCRDLLKLGPPVESGHPIQNPRLMKKALPMPGAPPGADGVALPPAAVKSKDPFIVPPGLKAAPAPDGQPGAAPPPAAIKPKDPFATPPATPSASDVPAVGEPPLVPLSGGSGLSGFAGPQMVVPLNESSQRAERLMNIITTAVAPDSWQESGGFGRVAEYSGLLVVNHNARTHRQIEKVLSLLREAAGRDAEATKISAGAK